MPITVTKIHDSVTSEDDDAVYDVLFDNNYPANGYPVAGSNFGRKAIHSLIPIQKGSANRIINYDPTGSGAGTLRIWTAIGTEAVAATDQSSISCRVRVAGPIL